MARNRLRQQDIQVGAPLPWDTFDTAGRLLLRQGAVVRSQEQLERLIELGLFSDATFARSIPGETGVHPLTGLARQPVERERVVVFEVLAQLQAEVHALLLPEPVPVDFPERLLGLARRLQNACDIDSDAALAGVLLFRTLPYSIRHQCNAAVIGEMLCRQLSWPPERRLAVVAAALTMNIPMLALQDTLYRQAGPLDDAQRTAIRAHPAQAVVQLQELGVTDADWLNAIAQHHEALDGSGYPAALKGDDVVTQARILGLADKYCAAIAERGYRGSIPADAAMRHMLIAHGAGMDTQLAARLVREVGIFPPGTAVELSNKEIGMVVKRTLDPRHPVIRAVISAQGTPLPNFPKRLTSKPAFNIKSAVDRNRLGTEFDPTPLWYATMVARESPDAAE